jgi:hypothetical protein
LRTAQPLRSIVALQLGTAMMAKPRRMTGKQYMEALAALDLNQVTAGKFLDISTRTSHA